MDTATSRQHKAYDDYIVRRATYHLWDGRMTPKIVVDHEDTSVSSGSRIVEVGSAFRLRITQVNEQKSANKAESVS